MQVETFGQMDRVEKTEFILEQIRLVLDKKDYIKAQILSNKISRKAIKEADFQVGVVHQFVHCRSWPSQPRTAYGLSLLISFLL